MAEPMTEIQFAKRLGEVWDEAAASGVSWGAVMLWHLQWAGIQYGIQMAHGVPRVAAHAAIEAASTLMATHADCVLTNPESRKILGL